MGTNRWKEIPNSSSTSLWIIRRSLSRINSAIKHRLLFLMSTQGSPFCSSRAFNHLALGDRMESARAWTQKSIIISNSFRKARFGPQKAGSHWWQEKLVSWPDNVQCWRWWSRRMKRNLNISLASIGSSTKLSRYEKSIYQIHRWPGHRSGDVFKFMYWFRWLHGHVEWDSP